MSFATIPIRNQDEGRNIAPTSIPMAVEIFARPMSSNTLTSSLAPRMLVDPV